MHDSPHGLPRKQLLAWATGQIGGALRQKLEFVLEEDRIGRASLDRLTPHWHLQNAERKGPADQASPLGELLANNLPMVQPESWLK